MVVTSVLKISFAGEIRRLRVSLPEFEGVGAAAWLQALKDIVSQTLGIPSNPRAADALTLMYKEKDGELQVLNVASTNSFLSFSAVGGAVAVLRLFVEKEIAETDKNSRIVNSAEQDRRGTPSKATSSASQPQLLWKSDDGKASVCSVESRLYGRQPRLVLGKLSFLIHIKVSEDTEESPFDGSSSHQAVLSGCHLALRELVPSMIRTPGWHRVALEDGCSIALRQCLEQQLHLCLKHCPLSR